ncbi:MAG: glycosyltransferase family 2 protein [Acidimicrobiales bacterium]
MASSTTSASSPTPSCALGVRRTVFDRLGGFADGDGEDVDLCWRAQLAGCRLRHVPAATLHYRYRTSLPATFRQARIYGAAHPLLYRRYRDAGMPGRSLREAGAGWAGLLRMLVYTRTKTELARVVFLLGVYVGRILGSLRYRAIYL